MFCFYFRDGCSIGLPEMFLLTGGVLAYGQYNDTVTTVSRYTTSGWVEDLPELNKRRRSHGCGYYFNDDMQRVCIRNSN